MLKILIGFSPWLIYFALLGSTAKQNRIAIIAALIAVIVFNYKELRKGFILAWGTALFFVALLIISYLTKDEWIINNGNFISNIALTLIVWFSLIIKKPFSLQYARETTPEVFWNMPGFIRVNRIITFVWGIALSISTVISSLQNYYINVNSDYFQVISFTPIILAIWFTIKFPEWHRYRLIEKKRRAFAKVPHPFLSGNYAPVHDELDVPNLTVIGKIPEDLQGVYIRNGPNPEFTPISYTFPLDGDGMLHAVYLENGKARYRNRYVETKGLLAERRAGRAIYGGILLPVPVDQKFVGKDGDPGPIKDGAFIHIIRNANQYLAMWEAGPAYQVDRELNTLGEWCPSNTKPPFNVNAHYRLDPKNNELSLFSYDLNPPYLKYYLFDAQGNLIKNLPIDKPRSTMMHDFAATKNYIIFFDVPAVFDIKALEERKSLLQWEPQFGVRIGILNKSNYQITWIETEAFFNFHFSNAYEQNEKIIIDYVRYRQLSIGKTENDTPNPPFLYRTIVDLKTKNVSHQQLEERVVEFPRFNNDYNGKNYRFIYLPTKIRESYSGIMQYDLEKQTPNIHDFGEYRQVDEAVFVPRSNSTSENEGYVMLFVYNKQENSSEFVILDAQNFTAEPLTRIKLPRRVPHGLHGNWMPN